jgi:hypothetical protein
MLPFPQLTTIIGALGAANYAEPRLESSLANFVTNGYKVF